MLELTDAKVKGKAIVRLVSVPKLHNQGTVCQKNSPWQDNSQQIQEANDAES